LSTIDKFSDCGVLVGSHWRCSETSLYKCYFCAPQIPYGRPWNWILRSAEVTSVSLSPLSARDLSVLASLSQYFVWIAMAVLLLFCLHCEQFNWIITISDFNFIAKFWNV
jgi:hypothetical protein